MRYVALLRGINVGGSRLVSMATLKSCLEKERFGDVATYIQSGNVIFTAADGDSDALTSRVERALSTTFGFDVPVVIRTAAQMQQTVSAAPRGFGKKPDEYRYDVLFVKRPQTAVVVMNSITTKPGVDRAWLGDGVVYYARLIARATESHLNKVVSSPIYRHLTVRNWNTTRKLAELADAG